MLYSNIIRQLLIFLLFFLSSVCHALPPEQHCSKIISLAPSLTEILIELGLGKNLVAVTRYCKLENSGLSPARIGGLLDINLEAALLLNPDLVIGLPESKPILDKFSRNGITELELSNRSAKQIIQSLDIICRICRCSDKSSELMSSLQSRMESLSSIRQKKRKVKVAIIVISTVTAGSAELYLSGQDGFYSSLLNLINAENVIGDNSFPLPSASFESLAALSPEYVFFITDKQDLYESTRQQMLRYLPDAKTHQFSADYASIPGIKFPDLMEDMIGAIDN